MTTIRQYPDLCLTTPSTPFRQDEMYLAKDIGQTLLDVLAANRRAGIGLAAPQIGVNKRVFVLDSGYLGIKAGPVFINPTIIWKSTDTDLQGEGCLSFPDDVTVDVRRSLHITLCYDTPDREGIMVDLHELAARACQHEQDHLDGITVASLLSRQVRRKLERAAR